MMTTPDRRAPLVFIDDAHTFGGSQTALAETIRVVLSYSEIPVLCVCTARTRAAVEAVVGAHPRLSFEEAPSALPLNLFLFPLRLPSYWRLLRRIERRGVLAWWLNQPDIEFCLAPLLVLKAMRQTPSTYLHGTGRFTFFHRSASWRRRLLSHLRDAVANRFVFRLHASIFAPSRASQAEVESRITSRRRPHLDYLYPPSLHPSSGQEALLQPPAAPMASGKSLQLWMLGNVVQGHKNHRAALYLLEYLARTGQPATLTLAGAGPDLASFQDEANRLGLADRIVYLGWVKEPCALAPPPAIVFIPSFHETMSLVAREAMMYGLRLVVSPIPVFHEWIPEAFVAEDFSTAAFAARVLEVSSKSAEELTTLYLHALDRFSDEIFMDRLLQATNKA